MLGCDYGRVLNIPSFEYARFLYMQAFHKVLNIPESGQIMPHSRVLNKHSQRFTGLLKKPPIVNMARLRIWQGCEYARVTKGAE